MACVHTGLAHARLIWEGCVAKSTWPLHCLCECAGVTDDITWLIFFFFFFFLLFFFLELVAQRASIDPQHHITPWGAFAFLYAFGKKSGPGHCVKPLRLIIGLICTLCASHSVRSRKWWQIVRGGSQGAQWNQLSISHFPLFVFSMPHGLPYAPILIRPISDCPALVRTPVKCGGVQRVAQRNSPSVR